ncbi:hypothetical protein [Vibrio japonicus]|uniref:Uncharacterized protein n=1 Tax=Vibrio japonicus TaxID=1824638 RepID=A0ABY5LIC8_9VIBR|nr:hypothetical protein [Vibrio japonicus]UUM30573.1 hypothetical protein NP165_12965 [Vibrio japonicus]
MAKRLCKMSRKQIADNLGEIHRLVVEPKFVCRSCARSSASKGSLCKPAAIPPQYCQSKPIEQQRACGLLAEAIPTPAEPTVAAVETKNANKAQAVRRVIDRVKEKSARPVVETSLYEAKKETVQTHAPSIDLSNKKSLKKAKKELKKYYKQQKKLLKLAKKQHKLFKHQRKLENKLEARMDVASLLPSPLETQSESKVH